MLRFDNFKSVLPADILKRGRDYYRNHHILDLSYDDEDTWTAQVEGTELYDVEVMRQADGTLNCSCTCPAYDRGDCKHIAAVLYAIEADFSEIIGKKKSSSSKAKPTKKETLRRALEALSQADLVQMLMEWAESDRAMTDQLLLRLGAKGDSPADYVTMVKAALRTGKGEYGYIDRTGANRIARQLDLIIGQANAKQREGQPSVAIAIFQAILDTMLDAIEQMELSDSLYDTLQSVFEGLKRSGSDLAPTGRRPLIEALIAYGKHPMLSYMDWEAGPYEIAADVVATTEDREFFLTEIKKASQKSLSYSALHRDYVAELEFRIIKRLDSAEDVDKFITAHSHLDAFRIEIVRRAIETKDFATAKNHIAAATRQNATGPRLMGYVSVYDVLGLEVAKQENDTPQIIALARRMWLTSFSEETYRLLKNTVERPKWSLFVDDLVRELRDLPEIQAWIYNQEQRWKDLFHLVRKNPSKHFLSTYQTTLEQHFPDEIVKFYEGRVFDMLRQASSRDTYQNAAGLLQRIQALGYEEKVEEIVALLKAEYPKRRALMEELKQL